MMIDDEIPRTGIPKEFAKAMRFDHPITLDGAGMIDFHHDQQNYCYQIKVLMKCWWCFDVFLIWRRVGIFDEICVSGDKWTYKCCCHRVLGFTHSEIQRCKQLTWRARKCFSCKYNHYAFTTFLILVSLFVIHCFVFIVLYILFFLFLIFLYWCLPKYRWKTF